MSADATESCDVAIVGSGVAGAHAAHEHPNLSILGPSTHVSAPVNAPSLTIAAMAYRLADRLGTPGALD